ncbi:hypothetical protein C8F04DRAFT_1259242 [Mycena alexandri]|uniref:NodB homology domain-containing protein n=1 Tax=Mycena alexandri TaxID=1745969 RepID=A0AAD6SW70_9AGAR|nr:hypothetical protein C8F04DRAFT_1259242 [Mycena alexandri]
MSIPLLLTTLLTTSVVFGSPNLRRAPQVYDACINTNDIALTFDDGPYIYLRSISDQFTAAGAKATFFFNGNNWDCIYNPDRISDINHTWSHADLTTLSTAQIQDGMFRVEEALSRIIGIKPAFMRPPYGSYNGNIQSIAAARGQNLALWDWDTGDADGNTTAQSEALYNDVVSAKVKNALILEHETEETTATVLVPFAIKLFQGKGYNLVTMAQCLGVDPYQAIGVAQQQTSAWTCDDTPDPGEACSGSIACETGTPVFSSTTTSASASKTTTTTTTSSATAVPTGVTIRPGASASTCLTASSNADGATVVVQPCTANNAAQAWVQNGQTLVVFGNKCLDVTNGVTNTNGVKMQIWSCTPGGGDAAQHWTTTSTKTIQWVGQTECLDLSGGSLTSGNQVQVWLCETGNTNQVWNLVASSSTSSSISSTPTSTSASASKTTTTTTSSSAVAVPTGVTIRPGASASTCLSASSNTNGATVVVQPCTANNAAQSWVQNGQTLVVFGNMCLDVTNGVTNTNGVKMQIWSCTPGGGDAAQHWTTTSTKTIQWVGQTECLDLSGGSLTSGNQVQVWLCEAGNTNQVWNLVAN